MDKLRAMQTFVRIVEAGSLSGAAAALGVSGPSVVRSLAALERSLGSRLLHRTTRRSSLTDAGREYYARCRRILAEVDEADRALDARRGSPRGRLRLTAAVSYGRMHVAAVVMEFCRRYPEVEVELLLLDRVVDLVEEGVDAAVRIGALPDSSLIVRQLGMTGRVVCASPRYLEQAGALRRPADLAGHRSVVFTGLAPDAQWSFAGKPARRAAPGVVLQTNQLDVAVEACVAGLGLGQFLSYQVAAQLDAGRLRPVLAGHEPPALPIQVVYPSARLLSANVRAFLDLAVQRLAGNPFGATAVPAGQRRRRPSLSAPRAPR